MNFKNIIVSAIGFCLLVIVVSVLFAILLYSLLGLATSYPNPLNNLSDTMAFIIILVIATIPGIFFIYFLYNISGKKRYVIPAGVMALVVGLVLFSATQSDTRSYPGLGGNDHKRLSDMRPIKSELFKFAEKNKGLFPPIPESCKNIDILNEYIDSQYITHDPEISQNHPDYQISVDNERTTYILRLVFRGGLSEWYLNQLYLNGVSGQVMGCDCDKPAYCFKSNDSRDDSRLRVLMESKK